MRDAAEQQKGVHVLAIPPRTEMDRVLRRMSAHTDDTHPIARPDGYAGGQARDDGFEGRYETSAMVDRQH